MASNNSIRYDSAVSAKEKAEAMFKVQDYEGAVLCANVAKGLFPGLEGIDHMLAAYQVQLAAAKKDWRAVLGVDASANLREIKKQYKRKAILVHPDKNSSEAANDALKQLMKAYEVLSMKSERSGTAVPGSSSNCRSQPASSASSSNRRSQPASSSNRQAQPASSMNRRSQSASSSNCRSERCPRCQKVCSFDTVYCSSITCTDCERRFFFRDGIFYYFECN